MCLLRAHRTASARRSGLAQLRCTPGGVEPKAALHGGWGSVLLQDPLQRPRSAPGPADGLLMLIWIVRYD